MPQRPVRHLAAWTVLLLMSSPAAVGAQEITGGRLTMEVDQAPLEDVLMAIADAAGIDLRVQGDLGEVAPQRLEDVPLEAAIRRLAGPHALVMIHAPGEGADLRSVRVYGISGDPEQRREAIAERAREVKARRRESSPALDTGDRGSRVQAVRDLARRGDPEAVGELSQLLAGDDDPAVRRLAAGALAGIGGQRAVDGLAGALGDTDRSVRLQALRGLYGLLRDDVTPYLEQVVRAEPDPGLRLMALEMARDLPDEVAGEVLQEALDDADPEVRAVAEEMLGR